MLSADSLPQYPAASAYVVCPVLVLPEPVTVSVEVVGVSVHVPAAILQIAVANPALIDEAAGIFSTDAPALFSVTNVLSCACARVLGVVVIGNCVSPGHTFTHFGVES